jgi:hypothetical protein
MISGRSVGGHNRRHRQQWTYKGAATMEEKYCNAQRRAATTAAATHPRDFFRARRFLPRGFQHDHVVRRRAGIEGRDGHERRPEGCRRSCRGIAASSMSTGMLWKKVRNIFDVDRKLASRVAGIDVILTVAPDRLDLARQERLALDVLCGFAARHFVEIDDADRNALPAEQFTCTNPALPAISLPSVPITIGAAGRARRRWRRAKRYRRGSYGAACRW